MNRQDAKNAKTFATEPAEDIDDLARSVVDAALEVHKTLGPGFLESVYENALLVELRTRGIDVERQVHVTIRYKQLVVGRAILDLLVARRVVVELKACDGLLPIHVAQLLSYVRATKCEVGLLINFDTRLLRDGLRRVVLSRR